MNDYVSNEEYFEISRYIEKHHGIFYKFWEIGKPVFVSDTETAYVSFSDEGEFMEYCFSFDYWKSLNNYQRSFVICHEILHLLLEHGQRANSFNINDEDLLNKAMDIVINHLLVNSYGFNRDEIKDSDKLCWVDTIFNDFDIGEKENFEKYFNLLKKSNNKSEGIFHPDDHSKIKNEENSKNFSKKVQDLIESMSREEKEVIKDIIDSMPDSYKENAPSGNSIGNIKIQIPKENVKPKRKWESVIKKWANYQISQEIKEQEQWARVNRRFVTLKSDFFIPTEMEIDVKNEKKEKIDVWFFQDTSGSCAHLAKRFFKAARSLPKDKFNVRMFCFDIDVYETTLESGTLYGFGGTRFDIIETKIINLINYEKINYPKAVFIITDGFGNSVYHRYPENWYWFLSVKMISCIPKKSHIFDLKNYE